MNLDLLNVSSHPVSVFKRLVLSVRSRAVGCHQCHGWTTTRIVVLDVFMYAIENRYSLSFRVDGTNWNVCVCSGQRVSTGWDTATGARAPGNWSDLVGVSRQILRQTMELRPGASTFLPSDRFLFTPSEKETNIVQASMNICHACANDKSVTL